MLWDCGRKLENLCRTPTDTFTFSGHVYTKRTCSLLPERSQALNWIESTTNQPHLKYDQHHLVILLLLLLRGYAVASSSDDRMNEPPTSLGLVPHQVRHTCTQTHARTHTLAPPNPRVNLNSAHIWDPWHFCCYGNQMELFFFFFLSCVAFFFLGMCVNVRHLVSF